MKIIPRSLTSRLLVVLAITLLTVAATIFLRARARRAAQDREAGYQTKLHTYSGMITPGMTRKDVEARLRANKVKFENFCCMTVERKRDAWDDLILIGEESAPWFCSNHYVYVGIEFSGPGSADLQARDSDTVKEVRLFHHLDGCL